METKFSIDPKLLATLDDLSFVARTVVEGFLSGLHRSPFLGYSSEFAAYRPYMQGDNLRHVDWKVWGRSDELYVKQFEDDTNLRCHILLDVSASMDFGAQNKFHYGKMLAAALSYLMVQQHDAAGLVLFNDRAWQALPARSGQTHLDELLLLLARTQASGRTEWSQSSASVLANLNRRGVVVVISDLLAARAQVTDLLRQLQFQRQEVVLFHLLCPEELDFNLQGRYLMQDAETGEEISLDATDFRGEYERRMTEFCKSIEQQCVNEDVDYQRLRTDQPLDQALAAYLARRMAV